LEPVLATCALVRIGRRVRPGGEFSQRYGRDRNLGR
jgi:hypothetical protein